MQSPKVSIIVPSYNQAQYLEDSLLSVFNQDYKNWECIIVDDGSTDDTKEVAAQWCQKDDRFKYFKKENGGLSSARNAGLDVARGSYIQFLDADDFIFPGKLSTQIALLNGSFSFDVAICDYYPSEEYDLTKRYEKGRYLTPFVYADNILEYLIKDWEVNFSIPCHCFLFRAFLFKEIQIRFDENLPNHEDWDCWMQVFSLTQSIVYTDNILAVYRIRQKAMCSNTKMMEKGFVMALHKQLSINIYNNNLKQLLLNRINIKTNYQNFENNKFSFKKYLSVCKRKIWKFYKSMQ